MRRAKNVLERLCLMQDYFLERARVAYPLKAE